MTHDEKLVEDVGLTIAEVISPTCGDDRCMCVGLRERFECRTSTTPEDASRALIPLIQKDMLERMMEPSDDVINSAWRAHVGRTTIPPALEGTRAEWQAMLRAFAAEIGIEIE